MILNNYKHKRNNYNKKLNKLNNNNHNKKLNKLKNQKRNQRIDLIYFFIKILIIKNI